MAVSIDTVVSAQGAAVSSLTFSVTVAGNSNRGFHVNPGLSMAVSRTITSITYAGTGLTADYDATGNTPAQRLAGYSLIAPSTGANNVVITLSGSATAVQAGAYSLYDCNQTTLTSGPQTSIDTDESNSVTVSSATNDLVISAVVSNGVDDLDTSQGTQRWAQDTLGFYESRGWTQPGATSVTQTLVYFNPYNTILGAVNIKQFAGGGFTGSHNRQLLMGVG